MSRTVETTVEKALGRFLGAAIRISTSGWHYKHWRGPFYPPDLPAPQMLQYYVERFDTVEINNSFYRLPSEQTFLEWKRSTPAGFCFAVKASRYLTHAKKLKDPEQGIERLFTHVIGLGEKTGPILFQLPPGWSADPGRLADFLAALPRDHHYAFEFRNSTWDTPEVYSILERYGAAYCIYHLAGFLSPLRITADFAYIRLHGPGGKYQGSYSDEDLTVWGGRIEHWKRQLTAIYVYFDNDQAGYAAMDALRLRRICGQR